MILLCLVILLVPQAILADSTSCGYSVIAKPAKPILTRKKVRRFYGRDGKGIVEVFRTLIESLSFPAGAAGFNAKMDEEMRQYAEKFNPLPENVPQEPVTQRSFCTVSPATGRFLSVHCTSGNLAAEVEPGTFPSDDYTFDLQTGKRLKIGDIGLSSQSLAALFHRECRGSECDGLNLLKEEDVLLDWCVLHHRPASSKISGCGVSEGIGYAALASRLDEHSPLYGVVTLRAKSCGGRTHGDIIFHSHKLTMTGDNYSFENSFMTVHGTEYPETENQYNAEAHHRALNELDAHLKLAKDTRDDVLSCDSESSASLSLAFGRFLAINSSGGGYCGGAHPSHGKNNSNLDLKTGKTITFAELFRNPVEARRIVHAGILEQAKQEKYLYLFQDDERYRGWLDHGEYDIYITERALYVDIPYYYHPDPMVEAEIPWKDLADLLAPAGPLGPFLPEIREIAQTQFLEATERPVN